MAGRNPLVRALVIFFFVVLLLLGIDIFLRLLLRAAGHDMGMAQFVRKSTRPGLRWELNPDHEEINSFGLRDRERTLVKEPGVIRVLCLGDSVTYGVGVVRDEAYPAALEELLSKRLGQGRAEVLNAGVPGYSSDQELAYLGLQGLDLKPDIVIVGFVLNDVITRFSGGMHRTHPAELFLRKHWAIYYCLRAAYLKVRKEFARQQEPIEVKARALAEEGIASAMEETWSQILAEQAAMEELCRGSGARFLLVVFPFRFQLEEPLDNAVAQRKILRYCLERGIPVLDLLPAFRERGSSLFIDSNHLSPAGNAVAAGEILDTIVKEKILVVD